ncbi:MAG: tetratricopeptide repeat protein [Litorimonas sp.]
MTNRSHILSALIAGTAFLATGCAVAPPMNAQEAQVQADLAVDNYMPATRQMRDAIETQELFAQAAFWSHEYNLNPADLESAIKLAAAVRQLGNPGRAVEITQTTRALFPRDPYLMAEYAAALIASERSLDAIPILNKGLSTTPSYGRLWSLKGAALDQQERYVEARQHYDRALRITPNDPNVMANIGLSHALSGDPATAEGWLRRAVSMPNASASVRQNLILVLQLQGKNAEAQKMTGLTQRQTSFPQMRPAHTPVTSQQSKTMQPTEMQLRQQQSPQARMFTGPTEGERFSNASEAARAMAAKRSEQQPTLPPQTQSGYQQPQKANPPQVQQFAPQGYPPLAGAPTPPQPERREPNRRRR